MQSIYLSIFLSIYVSIYLSIYFSLYFTYFYNSFYNSSIYLSPIISIRRLASKLSDYLWEECEESLEYTESLLFTSILFWQQSLCIRSMYALIKSFFWLLSTWNMNRLFFHKIWAGLRIPQQMRTTKHVWRTLSEKKF